MRIFDRNKENEEFVKYEGQKDDVRIEKLKDLLLKASQRKDEEEREKYEKASKSLSSLLEQIKLAKEEYSKVISEIMPVKYEIAEKRAEIEKLQADYMTILSRIKHAKDELDSINAKIVMSKNNDSF